ncbi:MAG: phosphotransferase family protein [Acidimicrobiia bacterium]|nr:phosphotransferase family protein [Acidimicrobiia bacterium]
MRMASPSAERLAEAIGAASVRDLERLTGGASRETWRFDAVGADGSVRPLILRRDPPGRPSAPGMMTCEAAAARACSAEGLPVPEVLVDAESPSPWETAGYVMQRVPGETLARRILRDEQYDAARGRLAEQCGAFLRGLHAIPVAAVPGLPARDPLQQMRETLPLVGTATPTMELAFRWLEANRPAAREAVIVHGDFRLGNLIVDADGLAAVLDWELLHVGDPVEDLGWLCTKAWRFGEALPVGGFATREELLAAYGGGVTLEELHWWEVLSSLKWSIGCMGQGAAHLGGFVRSVELAAVGRRVCEQEWDVLLLLCPDATERHRVPPAPQPAGGDDLHGRPTQAELAEAVEEFLRDEVMPGTSGRLSFMARVAANVVAMIGREATLGPAQAERRAGELRVAGVGSEAELAAAIAAGSFDDRLDELHELLASGVSAKLAVANPKYLANP